MNQVIKTQVPKPYDLAVVIGRFQLPHAGHGLLFNTAAAIANNVVVIKGSSYQPRTVKNPFTFDELSDVIHEYFKSIGYENASVVPAVDHPYSDPTWFQQIQDLIVDHIPYNVMDPAEPKPRRVAIVGYNKDDSSYYLQKFPQYDSFMVDEFKLGLDSTSLRNLLFEDPDKLWIGKQLILPPMMKFLSEFVETEAYRTLVGDYKDLAEYKEKWGNGPWLTADAVVIKSGHILLVQRGDNPGKGLWALPGGFVNPKERIKDAAFRELDEETKIDLPPALLRGAFKKDMLFDHPDRSLRGRVVTHAYLIDLDGHDKHLGLPKVKGSDDAKEAKWFPISDFLNMRSVMFEDHFSIISIMLGINDNKQ